MDLHKKMDSPKERCIDSLDAQILKLLLNNATMHHKDIAEKLNVSNATVHVRMKKLVEMGVILGTRLDLNAPKLGFTICAFIGIYLDKDSDYTVISEAMSNVKEIVEFHYCTGVYSILAKIICKGTEELRDILCENIQSIKGVQRTETFISLRQGDSKNVPI